MFFKKPAIIIAVLVLISLVVLYSQFSPTNYSFFPQCPFYELTGFNCPGCGSQRALHAILHGDLAAAVNYNLLFVVSLPFIAAYFGLKLLSIIKGGGMNLYLFDNPKVQMLAVLFVLIFWFVRNLPFPPFNFLAA